MARFRQPVRLRLAGTKKKHTHDSLHLLETARVKACKAEVRLPKNLSTEEWRAVEQAAAALADAAEDVLSAAHRAKVSARG